MAEKLVTFEGQTHSFPDDFTDAEISAALGAIPAANASASPKAKTWAPVDSSALLMSGAAHAAPIAQTVVEEIATNPNVVKTGKAAGQVAGLVKGLATGNPFTAIGATKVGGKTGTMAAQGAQKVAGVTAALLEKAAPYTQALSTASGAQGVLDLAQMAEPGRRDIGFLGASTVDPGDPGPRLKWVALWALLTFSGQMRSDSL